MIGASFLRKRRLDYMDSEGRQLGPYSRKWQAFGAGVIILGAMLLFNNYPFRDFKYDQYHGDKGTGPYQNLIDYVNQKGGLAFWAHPEAEWGKKIDNVSIETKGDAVDYLKGTRDYAGFTIFNFGYKRIGRPEGLWDELLKEYCEGRRKNPIWAIGGLGFDQKGDLSAYIRELRTVFLLPHLDRREALNALREGRVYVAKGNPRLVLDKFLVEDSLSGDKAGRVKISGSFIDGRGEMVKVNLIRSGESIKMFEVMSPFEISYQDDYLLDSGRGKKIYYRAEIHSQDGIIITNPIFVVI